MSILPSQTQASTPSSSRSPVTPNPNSHHGNLFLPPYSPPPVSSPLLQLQSFESLQISDSQSPVAMPDVNSGPSTPATEDSGGPSEKVTESGSPSGMKSLPHQNSRIHSQSKSGRRASRSSQSAGKMIGTVTSADQQNSQSLNPHGISPSAGRKFHMVNGNHLLNFHYDPISRPQARGPPPPPPRRKQKKKPYNKDLFLQANYKFMVLDSGDYSPESLNPDKMLQWEDIICVRYSTPFLVQCPICLEHPLCPQITCCGHIFCFPCILQYLLMGEEDHRGDCWKRCPLCFVMISAKDLYTIYIENVKQCQVGDIIEFRLLTRKKDSFTLSHKSKQEMDVTSCGDSNLCDPFSKFTLTSDVDLSVRQAISDLDGWLAKADSGLVDDLEKLPYVCAAMQQLEQRKKYWNDHRACDAGKSSRLSDCGNHKPSTAVNGADVDDVIGLNGSGTFTKDFHNQNKGTILNNSNAGVCPDQTLDVEKVLDQEMTLSFSYEEKNDIQRHPNGFGDAKESDSYNFYQAADGQHLILHPLNMKCLLHHYGSYDMLPHRISGRILQLETATQSEAMRRRYRYLSHFPLTTTFQLCEIDLSEMLPSETLAPFMDEMKKRANQRRQLAKKERKEKIKAEAAASTHPIPIPTSSKMMSHGISPPFSMDDFEALGNSAVPSSPPVVGGRNLFSNVTRLGFAAGHDSPSLNIQETNGLHNHNVPTDSSGSTGLSNVETPSFANVLSRAESINSLNAPKTSDLGKKGKKPTRVLLSTAGGRRY